MSGQYREDLAREIRAALEEFDDETKPVLTLVRDLVAAAKKRGALRKAMSVADKDGATHDIYTDDFGAMALNDIIAKLNSLEMQTRGKTN